MKLRTAFDNSFSHKPVLTIVDEKDTIKSVNQSRVGINLLNTKLNCIFKTRLVYNDVPERLEIFDCGVDIRRDGGRKSITLILEDELYKHQIMKRMKHFNFITVKDEEGKGDFYLDARFETGNYNHNAGVRMGLYFVPKLFKSTRFKVFEVVLSNVLNTNISESLQYYFDKSDSPFNSSRYVENEVGEYNLARFNERTGLYNSIQHIAAKFAYELNSLLVTSDSRKKDRARIIVDKCGELQIHGENLQGFFMNEFLTLFNKFSTRLGKALFDLGYKLSVEVKNSDRFSFFL